METITSPAPAPVAPARAYPIVATGSRVTYFGRTAVVVSGNEPNEWVENYPYVSIKFDTARGAQSRHIDCYATDLITL